MSNSQKAYEICSASPDDAEELLAIYAPYVENTAVTFEYKVPTVEEFRNRITRTLEKYPYLVAKQDDKILGFAYASPFRPRAAYFKDVETTIYIASGARGHGLGRALYAELERQLVRQGIRNLYACIASATEPSEYATDASIKFHERMGYRLVGTFKECGYKFDRWFDMSWYEKQI